MVHFPIFGGRLSGTFCQISISVYIYWFASGQTRVAIVYIIEIMFFEVFHIFKKLFAQSILWSLNLFFNFAREIF